ncbi:MAG: hypothetical protein KGL39_24665 [Patescibacteria group bacterium]|nr:hypothetical protein [Patescibacteria group bacterium]
MRTVLLISLALFGCAIDTSTDQPNTVPTDEAGPVALGGGSPRGGTPCAPVLKVLPGGQITVSEWLCQPPSTIDYKSDPEVRPVEPDSKLPPMDLGPEAPNLVEEDSISSGSAK